MQYKLINPSDAYTFISDKYEVATLTVFLLGTCYGAESEDCELLVPVFLLGGSREWYQENFNRTPDDGYEELKLEVAEALDSFMLGHPKDRRMYQAALNAITDEEKKKEFKKIWQDERSSMNNIGARAHLMAERIRENYQNEKECKSV